MRHDLGRRATSSTGVAGTDSFKSLLGQLKTLAEKVDAQDAAITALSALSSERVLTYVQNLHTKAIHGQRAGDSSSTICGMKVGPARIKRGVVRFLHSIVGECWTNLCERCLRPELEAAKALEEASIKRVPESSSKRLLEQ